MDAFHNDETARRATDGTTVSTRESALHDLSGRLSLSEVLLAIAEESESRSLQRVMHRLSEQVGRGVPLAEAVQKNLDALPAYFRHVLEVPQASDHALALLAGLAQQDSTRRRLQRQLRSALLYPAAVVTLLAALLIGAALFLVPQFEAIFVDFDMELPTMTRAVVATSKSLPVLLAALGCAVAAWTAATLLPGGPRLLHWLRTCFPIVGRVWIWSSHHEFSSTMGALTERHLPLSEALDCTAACLRDRNLARSAAIAARKCAAGRSLSESLAESIHFDRGLTALVNWGEMNDALPQALWQAAALFEEEIDLHTGFLRRVLPPLLFVVVLTVLFIVITSLMAPLVTLINALSG